MGMRDGLQFVPSLMVKGDRPKFSNSAGGYSRAAPQTLSAQRCCTGPTPCRRA